MISGNQLYQFHELREQVREALYDREVIAAEKRGVDYYHLHAFCVRWLSEFLYDALGNVRAYKWRTRSAYKRKRRA